MDITNKTLMLLGISVLIVFFPMQMNATGCSIHGYSVVQHYFCIMSNFK